MRIGALAFDDRPLLALAPLAGYTDAAFRVACRLYGAELTVSEMVSADGLVLARRNSKGFAKTVALLQAAPEDHPFGAQLFGKDPARLAEACRVVEHETRVELIDLNAGCPVRKVVNSGHGVALMRDPPALGRIVAAMRAATSLPLTVKFRAGAEVVNVADCARAVEDAGADAVIVHPRTRAQMFAGQADWRLIADVKRAVGVPVIGNGDVTSAADALRLVRETGCDGVMIGRGAVGKPWLFAEVKAALAGQPVPPPPDAHARLATLEKLAELMAHYKGARRAALEIRKFALMMIRGLPCGGARRQALATAPTLDAALGLVREILLATDSGGC
jgi:nifR3 family TIM-barrel protein